MLELDDGNMEARRGLQSVRVKMQAQKEKEKKLYAGKKLFDGKDRPQAKKTPPASCCDAPGEGSCCPPPPPVVRSSDDESGDDPLSSGDGSALTELSVEFSMPTAALVDLDAIVGHLAPGGGSPNALEADQIEAIGRYREQYGAR